MNQDFELDKLGDIPDPLADLSTSAVPPRRRELAIRPATRDRVTRGRATAFGAALACQGLWLTVFNKRADLATAPHLALFVDVAVPLIAAAVALGAAVAPGERGLGESKERLASWALLAPAIFVAGTLWYARASFDPEPFAWHAARCFLVTSLFALIPAALAAWTYRRSFVAAPRWRAAALGIACGALGASTMGLVCATETAAHVIVGHGAVLLAGALVGAWVGRKWGEA